ncbi:MAG: hypothetical protein K2J01_04525 [Clostridiales bacterium]|nr:hypothetical protein [Clostridiales bacterium]
MEEFAEISKKIKADAKQGDINIIYPFMEVQPNKKLSIVGIYDNCESSIVNGVGDDIPFVESEYYYGLTPAFGTDEICIALKNGNFKNSEVFEKFIDDSAHLFTVPSTMRKYARALFAKTLVKMSTMFGHSFVCNNSECYDLFCNIATNVATKNIDYDVNEQSHSIRLLGQPSEQFINALDDNFLINTQGELILKCVADIENIREKLSAECISLVQGKGYYSGVLPRVKHFSWLNMEYSNAEVMSLGIKFGRSTFATMDAFDSSYIKNHRLLEKYKPLLEEMDEHEDKLVDNLQNSIGSSENIMTKVNAFLELSYSAHNLAVSGNIITADGYLILAKRGQKTIDTNTYYCSINGQSEICDKTVGFYQQSVYEDIPTLHVDDKSRIDFMGELERETEAELNIICPSSHWELQGVSFLSIMNLNGKDASRRRFHFNILGECHTEYDLAQIIKTQKKATEKFENSRIIGVKIKRHKNVFSRIIDSIKSAFMWISKSKDLITSIFALAIFFMGLKELKSAEFTIKSLSSIFSIIFTSLSLIVLIKNIIANIIKYVKRKNTHLKLAILAECNDFYKNVHCKLKNKNVCFHPIADVMAYEYIKHSLI